MRKTLNHSHLQPLRRVHVVIFKDCLVLQEQLEMLEDRFFAANLYLFLKNKQLSKHISVFSQKKYFPALNTETTNVKCPSFSKSLIKQLKFLSSDNVGLRPVTLWKKRFWHSYYPENFAESKEHIHSILKERTSLQEMLISVRTRQSHSFISH